MKYNKHFTFLLCIGFVSALLSLSGCSAASGKEKAAAPSGSIGGDNADSDKTEANTTVSGTEPTEASARVDETLRQMNDAFKQIYSQDTAYDTYIADGFCESCTEHMTTDEIRFESYYFCGTSGADIKRIDADGSGGYILTYIYAVNNNEYETDETKPAGGTVIEADWNIGVLTYNTTSQTSEYTYYTGMYEKYFYEDDYTCRYLYDNQGNTCFLFGYKQ